MSCTTPDSDDVALSSLAAMVPAKRKREVYVVTCGYDEHNPDIEPKPQIRKVVSSLVEAQRVVRRFLRKNALDDDSKWLVLLVAILSKN